MLGVTQSPVSGQRERLLDAARQVFAVRAYDQVTIADIAVIAGVPMDQVYSHFLNKRELYLENLQAAGRDLIRRTVPIDGEGPGAGVGSGLGLGPMVRQALRAFLQFVEDNPVLYRAITDGGPGVDDLARDVVQRVEEQFTHRILQALGVTRPSPQIQIEMAGWLAFVQRTAARWLDHPGISMDELGSIQVRQLMNALRIGGPAA